MINSCYSVIVMVFTNQEGGSSYENILAVKQLT